MKPVPLHGRYLFIETKSIEEAARAAPWAAIIFEVQGGYRAYESYLDFKEWLESW